MLGARRVAGAAGRDTAVAGHGGVAAAAAESTLDGGAQAEDGVGIAVGRCGDKDREHERRPSSCQPAVGASAARQFWLRRERSSEALERETVRV